MERRAKMKKMINTEPKRVDGVIKVEVRVKKDRLCVKIKDVENGYYYGVIEFGIEENK